MMKSFIVIFVFLVTSCESYFTESIPVTVQSNSTSYLMYLDENNITKNVIENTSIQLKKNKITPILLFNSELDTKPLGCIYPFSTTYDIHSGFAAWILYKLLVCSNENYHDVYEYVSHFNWERFIEEIKKYEDPWMLNQDILFENICDRTFNVYSIKEL